MGYVNINDVSCTSKTGYKILKDINLNVEKGECILLMGLTKNLLIIGNNYSVK